MARQFINRHLIDFGEARASDCVKDRLEKTSLAACLQVAHGRLEEGNRSTTAEDAALGDFPFAPRSECFGRFALNNACALVHRDASDGAADVPERGPVPAGELKGHGRAS